MSNKNEFNTIKEMLEMIDMKINHIEDVVSDNRSIIIKLVKQSNQIVKFLKELEMGIEEEYAITNPSTFDNYTDVENKKIDIKSIEELIDSFMEKNKELKEFEKELKKNKDKLTPGTIGES